MVDVVAHARITDVIYAQLSHDGDLYNEIMALARRENITTGVVLNIVGGLKRARLSMPVGQTNAESQPAVLELDGMMECSGHGMIARTVDTYDSEGTSGIVYRAGEPNLHIHISVTIAGKTYMGHLLEGCLIRSLHQKSHFTIVVAKTEGAMLDFKVSRETTAAYPKGIPLHDLQQV